MSDICRLFFVGDVLLSNFANSAEAFEENVCKLIKEHDIACCNFEAPIAFDCMKEATKVGPTLKQNREAISVVKDAGFNLIGLANNHIMDYGLEGLKKTIDSFGSTVTVGAAINPEEVYKPYIVQIYGVKIGFIMLAENGFGCANSSQKPGYAWMLADCVAELIQKTKKESDILIINCHAGVEHWEYPLPELRQLYKKWIDLGADIIVGHHPHIVQGWETYNNGLIYYSLGNFIFDSSINGAADKHTIGISVTIEEKLKIKSKIYYFTGTDTGQIVFSDDSSFKERLKQYADLLDTEQYYDIIERKCQNAYHLMYKGYYNRVVGLYENSIMGKVKSFVRRIVLKEKFSDEWLFHNTAIETHHWVIQRALTQIIK